MSEEKSKRTGQVLAEDIRVKVRAYKTTGDADQEFVFTDIRGALKKYVEIRDSIPDFRYRMSHWPTIWVRTGDGFRRVHDFAYTELTDGNIAKYLEERIIDRDELLAGFQR